MMPQRSEHRFRYLGRGEGKARGKSRDGRMEARQEGKQPVRTNPSLCLTFMKRQQAGRETTFFSAIRKSEREGDCHLNYSCGCLIVRKEYWAAEFVGIEEQAA